MHLGSFSHKLTYIGLLFETIRGRPLLAIIKNERFKATLQISYNQYLWFAD